MAAPHILRQRNEDALDRAQAASDTLAERYPELSDRAQALRDAETTRTRDYLHTESNRLVALADLLEAVVQEVVGEEAVYDFAPIVGSDGNDSLHAAGYTKPADVREASDEDLLALDGIGPKKLQDLREGL